MLLNLFFLIHIISIHTKNRKDVPVLDRWRSRLDSIRNMFWNSCQLEFGLCFHIIKIFSLLLPVALLNYSINWIVSYVMKGNWIKKLFLLTNVSEDFS